MFKNKIFRLCSRQARFSDVIVMTIIGGILGSLFILGVFVWKEVEIFNTTNNVKQLISKVVNVEKEEVAEDKKDEWTTYTNEEYGFSFEYPENLNIKYYDEFNKLNDILVLSADLPWPQKGTSLQFREVDISIEEFIDNYNKSEVLEDGSALVKITSQEDYNIGGVDALLLKGSTDIGATNNMIFVINNGRSYIITFMGSLIDEESKILETFKFLDEEYVGFYKTADYEFHLPDNWIIAESKEPLNSWELDSKIFLDSNNNEIASLKCPLPEVGYEAWTNIDTKSNNFNKNDIDYIAKFSLGEAIKDSGLDDLLLLKFYRGIDPDQLPVGEDYKSSCLVRSHGEVTEELISDFEYIYNNIK